MRGESTERAGTREIQAFERVVLVCDRFEAAWRAGCRPALEDYLQDTPQDERARLLTELLELELELRQGRGEAPTRADYLGRFPDQTTLIDKVFAQIDASEKTLNWRPSEYQGLAATGAGWRFGDYELLEEIAYGGMGIVYKARHLRLDRLVALKMILVGRFASPGEVHRFELEARAAAALRHPGIVPVHDLGLHEGRHYIAMEFIEGPSLARRIAAGPLEQREAARLIQRISEAIQFAHDRGIIHRDLKPGNVLLDAEGNPLVTDFGLAKSRQADSQLTVSGQAVGTPSYMPPEQARGHGEIGPEADVYSLGATLYCLVTGRPPFQAATSVETLQLVLENEPVPPRRLNPRLDRDLEVICLKCLHKDPARRYARADALARDLGRYLAGEPIEARPVGWPEKALLWAKKNPSLARMSAAVVLLTVLLIGASILYTLRIRASNEENKHKLMRQYVQNGTRCLEDGESLAALPWFASALQLEAGNARRERLHRLRIHSVLASCPRLIKFMPIDGTLTHVPAGQSGTLEVRIRGPEARVWDTATGKAVSPPLRHSGTIKKASFSNDGVNLATASADGTARVWNARTGVAVTAPLKHRDEVNDVSFSPDDRFLLTAVGSERLGPVGEAVVWDLKQPAAAVLTLEHNDDVYSARFSGDGKRIVTASYDKTARVWDAATGAAVGPALRHAQTVTLAVFDPDGGRVVTVSGEEVRVWDVVAGVPTTPPLRHRGPVLQVVFSPDGGRFLTEAHDRKIRVWDTGTGEQLGTAIPEFGESTISFEADGRQLHIRRAWGERSLRVWDSALEDPGIVEVRHQYACPVVCAVWSADGRRFLTASADQTWRIWDARDGHPLIPPIRHGGPIRSAALSPDGRYVLTGGDDFTARIWDAATGELVSAPMTHSGEIRRVAFSPDGRRVLTASRDGTARLWDHPSGRPLTIPMKHGHPIYDARFHPDGQRIATASNDGTVYLWDLATGRPCLGPLKHSDEAWQVGFSPDGRRLVTTSLDRTARVWDCQTGRELTPPLRHDGAVLDAAFSPDGRHIVTASSDRTARVWDAATGTLVAPPLAHSDRVIRALFDPAGLMVITATGDPGTLTGEARLWDAATGDSVLLPLKHNDDVNMVVLSPEGRRILTASWDQTARIWPIPTDDRPVEDILMLAGLLSGSRVDPTGGLVPLSVNELSASYERLRTRYPESFACTPLEIAGWHERQAASCESQRNWSGAALHLARVIEAKPDAWSPYAQRAQARAELGEWKKATEDCERATRAGADDPLVWFSRALLNLTLGDQQGYREARTEMFSRFLAANPSPTKNLLAWTSAFHDDPEGNPLLDAVRLAEESVADRPLDADYLNTLGAALYRAGRDDEAVLTLNKAIEVRGGEGVFLDWLFLAMAHARQGHSEPARRYLEKADRWWAKTTSSPALLPRTASPMRWYDRILFQMLHREAGEVLMRHGWNPGAGPSP